MNLPRTWTRSWSKTWTITWTEVKPKPEIKLGTELESELAQEIQTDLEPEIQSEEYPKFCGFYFKSFVQHKLILPPSIAKIMQNFLPLWLLEFILVSSLLTFSK